MPRSCLGAVEGVFLLSLWVNKICSVLEEYHFSPNSVGTLRGSCGKGKEGVLRPLFRAGVSGQFAAIDNAFMPLDIINAHFDCAGSQNLPARDGCFRRLRSRCGAVRISVHGGHFS